jgi:hypothetical protein
MLDERPANDVPAERSADGYVLLSFLAHAAFLWAAAMSAPALADAETWPADDARYLLAATFTDEAERELDESGPQRGEVDEPDLGQSKCGEHGGTMGAPRAAIAPLRYGIHGPADNPDPHLARTVGNDVPWETVIGPHGLAIPGGTPDQPLAPWGRDDALGNDADDGRAAMWGDAIGTAFGSPGLGFGRKDLCPTCGGHGQGTYRGPPRLHGVAVGTEPAHLARR